MLYSVPFAYGLDFYVERANGRLYSYLKSRWGVTDGNYNCFGRAVRNRSADGYIPEYYDAATGSYVGGGGRASAGGLFFEDRLAAVSFWGLADPVKRNERGDDVARMQLIFFVDTAKLMPGGMADNGGQRLDDVCVNDVRNFMRNNGCGFTVCDVYRDVDKVLERYPGAIKRGVVNRNMGRLLCFRIDVELRYNPQIFTTAVPGRQFQPMERNIVLFIKSSPDLTKKIAVGNGQFIYQEYAPGNVLTPVLAGTATPYLAGKNVLLLTFCNQIDLLAGYDAVAGAWSRSGDPGTYGFNDGDFAGILFTDMV